MPVDDNTNESFSDFGDVLCELSSLLAMYDDYDVIIWGDFNVDFNRPSRNLSLMLQFISHESLTNVPFSNNDSNHISTFESGTGYK